MNTPRFAPQKRSDRFLLGLFVGALAVALAVLVWRLWLAPRSADGAMPAVPASEPFRFAQQDGAALYRGICQGCHMPDGRGATGAGSYPALASNAKLEDGAYPVFMVVNGRKAMPSFGDHLSDEQVAAVVNYVRRNFGNQYLTPVQPKDVAAARPENKQ